MNEIKYRTLELLSQNCRFSTAEIAKKIKKPRHLVAYHRDKLMEKVIKGNELLLNYETLGYTEFLVYLKLFQYSKVKDQLIEKIKKHSNIRWLGEIFPNFNIRFSFVAKKYHDVESFLYELEEKFGKHIIHKEILISRGLLKKESYTTKKTIENKKQNNQVIKLLDSDKTLIKALALDPTKSLVGLSKETGFSIESIRQKISKYLELGVVDCFSAKHDAIKVGYNFWCVVLLKLNKLNKHHNELQTLLYSDVKYGRTRKTIGAWNIEMTIFSPTYKQLLHIIDNLENQFGDDLDAHQIQVYRRNILPKRIAPVIFEK